MTKLHGCGNKFLIMDEIADNPISDKKAFVEKNAETENVDGVLFLSYTRGGNNLEMKIFDRDGTEESMCGNGIRCFARYAYDKGYIDKKSDILTGDGFKNVEITNGAVNVCMGSPRKFRKLSENEYFIFTGVPHLVLFGYKFSMDKTREIGRRLRNDKELCKKLGFEHGININFVSNEKLGSVELLTYEVGVEDITNACGTGSTASAYVSHKIKGIQFPITVKNIGGDLEIDYRNGKLFMSGPAEYL